MQFRFRYLAPDGREVQVETIDALRDLLRRGEIAPDTLLYDALTAEWAPLRAHAVVRLLEDVGDLEVGGDGGAPGVEATLDAAEGAPEAAHAAPEVAATAPEAPEAPAGRLPTFQLDPSFGQEETSSTEDAVRELLKEREREERDSSPVLHDDAMDGGMVVDAGFADPRPAPPPPPRRRKRERPRPAPAPVWGGDGPPAEPPRLRVPSPEPAAVPRDRPVRPLFALGCAGFLALGLYAVGWSSDHPEVPADVVVIAGAEAPAPGGAATAASLMDRSEAVALADMVEALDSLRLARGLGDLPPAWLEGIYLANASRYPEVPAYWNRYQDFVDEVRTRETALFRQSFVRRLEGQGVEGPMIPMRLARAVRVFEERQASRDSVYDAMLALAGASLELHALLEAREDDIVYDPVLPDRVSRDPVVEAVTDDPELRAGMWDLLDRIFYNLSALSGGDAGTRDALTERTLDGIRAEGF